MNREEKRKKREKEKEEREKNGKEKKREKSHKGGGEVYSLILTDNLLPLSSSVDNSSRDVYNRERRHKIIGARITFLTKMK